VEPRLGTTDLAGNFYFSLNLIRFPGRPYFWVQIDGDPGHRWYRIDIADISTGHIHIVYCIYKYNVFFQSVHRQPAEFRYQDNVLVQCFTVCFKYQIIKCRQWEHNSDLYGEFGFQSLHLFHIRSYKWYGWWLQLQSRILNW